MTSTSRAWVAFALAALAVLTPLRHWWAHGVGAWVGFAVLVLLARWVATTREG